MVLFCFILLVFVMLFLFFFNDTATTEIYTLSLHDALPILSASYRSWCSTMGQFRFANALDRKSTRLNSSHLVISYAVFCLKKKKHKHLHGNHSSLHMSGLTYTRHLNSS